MLDCRRLQQWKHDRQWKPAVRKLLSKFQACIPCLFQSRIRQSLNAPLSTEAAFVHKSAADERLARSSGVPAALDTIGLHNIAVDSQVIRDVNLTESKWDLQFVIQVGYHVLGVALGVRGPPQHVSRAVEPHFAANPVVGTNEHALIDGVACASVSCKSGVCALGIK